MTAIRTTHVRVFTILLGSVATLVGILIAPVLPAMSEHFQDVPNAEFLVRLTLTLPALFIAVSAPFAGMLLDRWGRRPVLIASLIIYLISGTSGFVADSLVQILVGRAFLGIATAGLTSGLVTVIADEFSGDALNRFMGFRTAATGAGGMALLLSAGFLAELEWRFPFLLFLIGLPVAVGVLLSIREPSKPALAESTDSLGRKVAFPWSNVVVVYASALVAMFIFAVYPVQLPFFLIQFEGASSSQVGIALALQTLSSVAAALQYQRFRRWFSFQGIFGLTFLSLGVSFLLIAASSELWLVYIGMAIGGLSWGMFPSNLVAWLARDTPLSVRGRAMGGMTTALFVGQFLTPILTQPLVALGGIASVFWAVGGVALLLMAVFSASAIVIAVRSRQGGGPT